MSLDRFHPATSAWFRQTFPEPTGAQAKAWPAILHKLVWLTNDQVSAYAGSGPRLTDDHPLTEYFLLSNFSSASGPKPIFERAAVETGAAVVGLLGLLIIGLAGSGYSRRRRSPGRR